MHNRFTLNQEYCIHRSRLWSKWRTVLLLSLGCLLDFCQKYLDWLGFKNTALVFCLYAALILGLVNHSDSFFGLFNLDSIGISSKRKQWKQSSRKTAAKLRQQHFIIWFLAFFCVFPPSKAFYPRIHPYCQRNLETNPNEKIIHFQTSIHRHNIHRFIRQRCIESIAQKIRVRVPSREAIIRKLDFYP